jgi:hypothetical protein
MGEDRHGFPLPSDFAYPDAQVITDEQMILAATIVWREEQYPVTFHRQLVVHTDPSHNHSPRDF